MSLTNTFFDGKYTLHQMYSQINDCLKPFCADEAERSENGKEKSDEDSIWM